MNIRKLFLILGLSSFAVFAHGALPSGNDNAEDEKEFLQKLEDLEKRLKELETRTKTWGDVPTFKPIDEDEGDDDDD